MHHHPTTGFEHVHRHSDNSLLDGYAKVREYAEYSKEVNQKFLVITDHGTMAAVPQQVSESEKHNLRPVFGCLLAGTPINTRYGVKSVEDVVVGDEVLTHKGRYRKVSRVFTRPYTGDVCEVKLADSTKFTVGFRLTAEHPIFVRCFDGSRSFIRVDEIKGGRPTTKRGVTQWNYYVCFPRLRGNESSVFVSKYLPSNFVFQEGGVTKCATKKFEGDCHWDNFPEVLHLNFGFARLLGLFCAEGSTRTRVGSNDPNGGITFSFNIAERDTLVDETCDLIEEHLGLTPVVYERPERGLCEVFVQHIPTAYFLRNACGCGSKTKRVPGFIFEATDQIKEAFLSGMIDGDGKCPEKDIISQATLRTASRDLAYGMKRLLADLRQWVNVMERMENGKVCYNVPYLPYRSYDRFLADEEFVYKPIREVFSEEISCQVYNFEVDEDNSYVSDFALHNCELYVNSMQPKSPTRAHTSEFRAQLNEEEQKRFSKNSHLLALAYTDEGYSNLVQITSWGWKYGFYKRPRVNHEVLMEHREGIIFTSTCANSEIANAFFEGGDDAGFAMIEKYMAMFGENFYLELMMLDFKLQKPYDAFLLRAHLKYGIPLILTQDCLVKGTLVLTNKGFKQIESVQVGDHVWTHENRWREVEVVGSRHLHDGERVFRVKTRIGTYSYEATGNHKVRVAHRSVAGLWSYAWKRTDKLDCDDYLLIPKLDAGAFFAENDLNEIDLMPFLSDYNFQIGTEYKSSRSGNMGCRLQFNETSQQFWSYRGWDRKCKTVIPRWLRVDSDLLKVIGWYIADGWSEKNSNQVGFAFHKDELEVAEWIISYFEKFGIKSKVYNVSKNGIAIRFSSVVFNRFFGKLCGFGANNKHLPYPLLDTWIKRWSKEQMLMILSRYWVGDGSGTDSVTNFDSTSKVLMFEVACVLNAMGMCVSPYAVAGNKETWSDNWNITLANSKTKQVQNWFENETDEDFIDPRVRGTRYFDLGPCWAVQITNISEIQYDDIVYDFQVAEDHSFTANLWTVSNCHYCRKDHSRYQRLQLMQQTGRTIQQIEELVASGMADDLFELQDQNLYMKSEPELDNMWETTEYRDIIDYELYKQAKANTVKICERAGNVKIDRSIKLPIFPNEKEELWEEIVKGRAARGVPNNKEYDARIQEEYNLICEKGFASYFIIQKMMIDEARRKCPEVLGWGDGSEAVGPGRGCLSPNTKVRLRNGATIPINQMNVGEEVFTRDGSLNRVVKVLNYPCDSELMLCLKTYYGDNEGVTLTVDHKVLAEKQVRPENWDIWSESTKKSRKTFVEPTGQLDWFRADELSVGDWCYVPTPKIEVVDNYELDLSLPVLSKKNGKKVWFDDKFVHHMFNAKSGGVKHRVHERYWRLDKTWATILGLFVGDGWITSGNVDQVGFCAHSDEREHLFFVESTMNKKGYECSWRENQNGKQVDQLIVRSAFVKRLFSQLHPGYESTANTKHVPDCILYGPVEFVWEYLKGYFMADGHEDEHKVKFETVSPVLAEQIRFLLLRVGLPSSISIDERVDMRPEFSNRKRSFAITCPLDTRLGCSRNAEKSYVWRKVADGFLLRIREVQKVISEGTVWDISVDQNHDYLTSSFVVHNSFCGSLVAYCMRLHDVEPVKHGLLFSRFLNPARGGKQMKTRFTIDPLDEVE